MDRSIYDGEPYYCQLCGAGGGEFYGCEMPDCKLESKASAEKRAEDHQRLMDYSELSASDYRK